MSRLCRLTMSKTSVQRWGCPRAHTCRCEVSNRHGKETQRLKLVRRKLYYGLVPGIMILSAIGATNLPHGDRAGANDSNHARIAEVLSAKFDIQHGVVDATAPDPDATGNSGDSF